MYENPGEGATAPCPQLPTPMIISMRPDKLKASNYQEAINRVNRHTKQYGKDKIRASNFHIS